MSTQYCCTSAPTRPSDNASSPPGSWATVTAVEHSKTSLYSCHFLSQYKVVDIGIIQYMAACGSVRADTAS